MKSYFQYYVKKFPTPFTCKKYVEVYPDCAKSPKAVKAKARRLVQEAMERDEEEEKR